MLVYLDTSAVAKWYLNEPASEAFSDWIRTQYDTHISSLTVLEFRCLLARRKRARQLSAELAQTLFAAFREDGVNGHLIEHPIEDIYITSAIQLMERAFPNPLRTLDAIHLRTAIAIHAEGLATADQTMGMAAKDLGLTVFDFAT